MRIRRRTEFTVTDGPVAIVDPSYVFDSIPDFPFVTLPANSVCFDSFGGDGNFSVYESPECVIVDTAPRQFKPKTRLDFARVDGDVAVDSGMIAFVNLADAPVISANPITCVTLELQPGVHVAWAEENENSLSQRRVILGIGPTPKLFLADNDATMIDEIEQAVAASIRLKGDERINALELIREQIADLHLNGCKDRRLRMLADAIKFKLPRRGRKNAT